MVNKKIGIIGLGLIGGSLAKALKNRLGITNIIAMNKDMQSITEALHDGVISEGYTELNENFSDCSIIFICTPVNKIIGYVDELSSFVAKSCIISDVGSTKLEVLRHVNSMPSFPLFIGGHPMTGSEKSGYCASLEHLFENAWYILTPSKNALPASIDFMIKIIEGIGALPLLVDAEEHDTVTAGISHVPHILASSLVNVIKEADSHDKKMQTLAAGGFKDITRIASANPEIWESIVSSNSVKIIELLDLVIKNLSNFKKDISMGESKKILDFFSQAKAYRDAMPVNKKGLISPIFDISVDVLDKPGIIGKVATLLGRKDINIKNIHVSNNREFEFGCLKISFNDVESMKRASILLSQYGYKVTIDQS